MNAVGETSPETLKAMQDRAASLAAAPAEAGDSLLTDPAELAAALGRLDDGQLSAVEAALAAERARRGTV